MPCYNARHQPNRLLPNGAECEFGEHEHRKIECDAICNRVETHCAKRIVIFTDENISFIFRACARYLPVCV